MSTYDISYDTRTSFQAVTRTRENVRISTILDIEKLHNEISSSRDFSTQFLGVTNHEGRDRCLILFVTDISSSERTALDMIVSSYEEPEPSGSR